MLKLWFGPAMLGDGKQGLSMGKRKRGFSTPKAFGRVLPHKVRRWWG